MAVRDDRSDVKQTTTGFRGPLMVQSLTSAKSKFLSLGYSWHENVTWNSFCRVVIHVWQTIRPLVICISLL